MNCSPPLPLPPDALLADLLLRRDGWITPPGMGLATARSQGLIEGLPQRETCSESGIAVLASAHCSGSKIRRTPRQLWWSP
jgi:hypothetical protein